MRRSIGRYHYSDFLSQCYRPLYGKMINYGSGQYLFLGLVRRFRRRRSVFSFRKGRYNVIGNRRLYLRSPFMNFRHVPKGVPYLRANRGILRHGRVYPMSNFRHLVSGSNNGVNLSYSKATYRGRIMYLSRPCRLTRFTRLSKISSFHPNGIMAIRVVPYEGPNHFRAARVFPILPNPSLLPRTNR